MKLELTREEVVELAAGHAGSIGNKANFALTEDDRQQDAHADAHRRLEQLILEANSDDCRMSQWLLVAVMEGMGIHLNDFAPGERGFSKILELLKAVAD